jgi:hypothetical protein
VNIGEASDVQTVLEYLLVDRRVESWTRAREAARRLADRSRAALMAGMDGQHAGPAFERLLMELPMICRTCGCTETDACTDVATGLPCHWVAEGLCSACGGPTPTSPELVGEAST